MGHDHGHRPLALVTGASGGIGEALAHAFAKGGYDLALVARSIERLEPVGAALAIHGARATLIAADLQTPQAGAAIEKSLAAKQLEVDVLVNNAGFGLAGALLESDLDQLLAVVDLNCRALTELTWRFGRSLKARGRGGVLNVASTAAFLPGPYMAVYYASKAYVLSVTEALNCELKGSGAHATALCPGPVKTGFQARARFDSSMRLSGLPMQTAQAVAEAGFSGFVRRKAVVVPGALNALTAAGAPFAPRSMLLSLVEQLQRKRSAAHG